MVFEAFCCVDCHDADAVFFGAGCFDGDVECFDDVEVVVECVECWCVVGGCFACEAVEALEEVEVFFAGGVGVVLAGDFVGFEDEFGDGFVCVGGEFVEVFDDVVCFGACCLAEGCVGDGVDECLCEVVVAVLFDEFAEGDEVVFWEVVGVEDVPPCLFSSLFLVCEFLEELEVVACGADGFCFEEWLFVEGGVGDVFCVECLFEEACLLVGAVAYGDFFWWCSFVKFVFDELEYFACFFLCVFERGYGDVVALCAVCVVCLWAVFLLGVVVFDELVCDGEDGVC